MTRMYRVSNRPEERNQVIMINDNIEDNVIIYPSEFFENGRKPRWRVPLSNLRDEELGRMAVGAIVDLSDNIDAIIEFMFRMMMLISFNWTGPPWVSFGLRIGEQGRNINPTDILEVERVDVVHNGRMHPDPCGPAERWKVFWGLVSMYRIMTINDNVDPAYKERVSAQVTRVYAGAPFNTAIAIYLAFTRARAILSEASDYSMAIAALDMFFAKFPKHIYSSCRISTIPTRKKACTALTGLADVADAVGKKPSEFIGYILDDPVAVDAIRLGKPGEEANIPDSYTHYLYDFRLTNKSPYSASANRYLHFWMHVVGCVGGSTRSMNAKILGTISNSLLTTGILAGEALRKNKKARIQFTSNQGLRDELVQEQNLEEGVGPDPLDTPGAVLFALIQRNHTIPEDRKIAIRGTLAFLRHSRPDTVGKAVADYLGIRVDGL